MKDNLLSSKRPPIYKDVVIIDADFEFEQLDGIAGATISQIGRRQVSRCDRRWSSRYCVNRRRLLFGIRPKNGVHTLMTGKATDRNYAGSSDLRLVGIDSNSKTAILEDGKGGQHCQRVTAVAILVGASADLRYLLLSGQKPVRAILPVLS
ncbi:unnamed protein product [Nesidiocoris tenuis]|uniref:Uncharacterized protein n=1 Tax=Nesidiocoris tenuis TaxID=355587 RepID=A0A6H5GEL0_9HEMI|nr:unnamed protein product [Nesidiocoris tenuis]